MEKIIRSTPVTGSRMLSEARNRNRLVQDVKGAEKNKSENHTGSNRPLNRDNAPESNEESSELSEPLLETNYIDSVLENEKQVVSKLQQENVSLQEQVRQLTEREETTQAEINFKQSQGFDEGYKSGYQEGMEKAETEFVDLKNNVSELIDLLKQSVKAQITEIDSMAVEIALVALCRIVESKIVDEEFVISAVRSVITNITDQPSITVRVNPSQLDTLMSAKEEFKSLLAANDLKLVSDARVIIGGCLLETNNGNWDGRLETQLQKLFDLSTNSEKTRL